eukprot:scaffold83589_cov84-Phaeocystis_antarctica.AAC.1
MQKGAEALVGLHPCGVVDADHAVCRLELDAVLLPQREGLLPCLDHESGARLPALRLALHRVAQVHRALHRHLAARARAGRQRAREESGHQRAKVRAVGARRRISHVRDLAQRGLDVRVLPHRARIVQRRADATVLVGSRQQLCAHRAAAWRHGARRHGLSDRAELSALELLRSGRDDGAALPRVGDEQGLLAPAHRLLRLLLLLEGLATHRRVPRAAELVPRLRGGR